MNESDYIKHRIPKRDGSLRIIMEPKPELKRRQKSIMHYLQSRGIRASKYSHGFVSGRSTATHARLHVGRRVIVKVDIQDFFGSVTSAMIVTALRKEKLQSEYINEIVEVCTLNAALPQGAPSSPLLSNIAFKEADYRIAGLAKKFRAAYSRYADDLCFSSNNYKLNLILPELKWILNSCGFKVNHKKTQVIRKGCRQIITGIVVNKKADAPRELRRNARARVFGLKMDLLKQGYFDQEECNSLKGLAAYLRGISPESGAKLSRARNCPGRKIVQGAKLSRSQNCPGRKIVQVAQGNRASKRNNHINSSRTSLFRIFPWPSIYDDSLPSPIFRLS